MYVKLFKYSVYFVIFSVLSFLSILAGTHVHVPIPLFLIVATSLLRNAQVKEIIMDDFCDPQAAAEGAHLALYHYTDMKGTDAAKECKKSPLMSISKLVKYFSQNHFAFNYCHKHAYDYSCTPPDQWLVMFFFPVL